MTGVKFFRVMTMEEASVRIDTELSPLSSTEMVDLEEAGGRYLAATVLSGEDLPGFKRATVDGYAVHAVDLNGAAESMPAVLKLTGETVMGKSAPMLGPEECCLVPTGGMLPTGADAVVMIEETERVFAVTGPLVQFFRPIAPGANYIAAGEDIEQGRIVIRMGCRLRAPELGLLAALGITRVKVYTRPKVGILVTGDEIKPVRTGVLQPGEIRDALGTALVYQTLRWGAEPLYGGILPDQSLHLAEAIRSMLEQADMIVVTGGSSVGERDYTAAVFRSLGDGELLIEGLAVQPGKPTLLGKCGQKPLFGLPGHPVSALTVYHWMGEAIIRRLAGASKREPPGTVEAILTRNIPSRPGRTDFVRVKLSEAWGEWEATPVFGRSGLLRTLAEADGYLVVPAAADGLTMGTRVHITLWRD